MEKHHELLRRVRELHHLRPERRRQRIRRLGALTGRNRRCGRRPARLDRIRQLDNSLVVIQGVSLRFQRTGPT